MIMPTTKIERSSNFELYRIIVMFLILCGHYVFNSDMLPTIWGEISVRSIFFYSFGIWGKTGINCFVMITGYFMCTSTISLRKFTKLLLEVEFYNFLIGGVFLATNYNDYSVVDFILHLNPIHSIETGFTSCFIIFYLTIPFLNILVRNIDRKMHLHLICLLIFTYTIMKYVPSSIVTFNYVSWFIVIYFIASYIRLYPKSIPHGTSAKYWGGLTLLMIVLSILSVFVSILLSHYGIEINQFFFVLDSNAIFALLTGISSFMLFKNLKIRQSKIINTVASTTFGILCIHANGETMRAWLWNDIVDCIGHVNVSYYALYAIGTCIIIFCTCSVLDWMRIQTIEKWTFKYLDLKIFNK